ncbi:hypothetical protein [Alicyclobacillus shizuokensis]|uniref:hypothetical protein n=1 Tax=Alicyclobacillus shizuokensis TaxID=392014 RepID=UPI000831E156|nr:hypothetical protein [Alicyclobacillus shizuokensis]
MKKLQQLHEAIDRFFKGFEPRKRKWKALPGRYLSQPVLSLYHYQHLVLVWDLEDWMPLYTWWQTQTDKRGLDAAISYLQQEEERLRHGERVSHQQECALDGR